VAASKRADLEAWETALRAAVLCAGAKVLGELLQGVGAGRRGIPGTPYLFLWGEGDVS
jgi:hypothetical protein